MAVTVHIDNLTLGGKTYNENDVILNPSANAIRVARAGIAHNGVVMLTESGDTSNHDRILINDISFGLGISVEKLSDVVIPRYLLEKAMVGDMEFAIFPDAEETPVSEATGKKLYTILLAADDGDTHSWYNAALDAEVTTDSTDGTVSIVDVAPVFEDGVCKIEVEYEGDWLVGEKATLTVKAATILGYTIIAATSVNTIIA
ncbi:MAG: hypothetical protein ACOX6M_12905 [Armatimonadota bacterium]|jgi:hypothetical protein